MPDIPVPHPVPWITQYATPGLIADIAYHGHPPADDPNWPDSGAPDQQAYGRWCTRLCGMACLKMALTARDGRAPSLFTLLRGCLDYGGYVEEPDGRVTGLLYRPFADFTRDCCRLRCDVITDLDPDRITRELDHGRLVMASVHKEIRRPEHDPPGTGGHLVLITGHRDGQVSFRNPSGHTPQAGRATLPMSTFDRFAAQRGISLHIQPGARKLAALPHATSTRQPVREIELKYQVGDLEGLPAALRSRGIEH